MIKSFYFTQNKPIKTDYITINGYAVDEPMKPCMVDRPNGTGDWLLMLFRTPSVVLFNKQLVDVATDTLVVWPPGLHHNYGNKEIGFSHSWIHCDGDRVRKLAARCKPIHNKPIVNFNRNGFEQNIIGINSEFNLLRDPDIRIVENHLENIFHLLEHYIDDSKNHTHISSGLQNAKHYMETNYRKPLRLEDLAKRSGSSVSGFSAKFKQVYGLSPIDYLIRYRLSEARRHLENKNLNITQVAFENGFDDIYYFSKMMKKYFGKSPRELRS